MEVMYATLLLHSAGKEINEENLKKVLDSVGAKTEEGMIKAVVAALEGKNIDEIIEKAAMPVAAPAQEAKEEKKEEEEEKGEEKKAEEAAAGLAALFG